MKQSTYFFLLLWLFGVSLSVQAQSLLQYVPNDVALVAGMNPNRTMAKVNTEKIKQMDFYGYLMDQVGKEMGNQSDLFKAFLNDPAQYGLGIYDESYLFMKVNDDGSSLVSYVFGMADQQAFAKFLDEQVMAKKKRPIQKMGNYQLIEDKEASIAWNDAVVLITSAQDVKAFDGDDLKAFDGHVMKIASDRVNQILSKGTSISADANFQKLSSVTQSDAFLFFDYGLIGDLQKELGGIVPDAAASGMMESMMSLYEGNYLMMGVNFENGSTRFDTKYLMNGEIGNWMSGITDNSFNPRFAKYLSKDMLGYYGMSVNIEKMVKGMAKIYEPLMGEAGMPDIDQLVEQGAEAVGLNMTAAEVYNIFEGDMLFTVSGMKEFEKEVVTYEYDEEFNRQEVVKMKTESLPLFNFMMTYNDENALMPLLQMGIDAGVMVKKGNQYEITIPSSPMDMYLVLNKGMIFVTNDANVVGKKMLKKGLKKSQRLGKEHLAALAANSQVGFWDIQKTLTEFGGMMEAIGGDEGAKMLELAKKNMQNMWITSGKVKNGMVDTDMILNFTNSNVNSLDQLFEIVNAVFNQYNQGQRM